MNTKHTKNVSGGLMMSFTRTFGRLFVEQVADKEILHPPLAVAAAHAVAAVWNDQQLEILVSFDERIDEPHGGFRRHVVVHFADDKEELSAEAMAVVDVRRLRIP